MTKLIVSVLIGMAIFGVVYMAVGVTAAVIVTVAFAFLYKTIAFRKEE